MNLFAAQRLAKELLRAHGLADRGWTFRFDHARRRFGCCIPALRRITLSRPLTLLNGEDEVRDTILHEIAHALTPGDGHGAAWKAMCIRIGAKPVRCYQPSDVHQPPRRAARWQLGCPRCDTWTDRARRPRQGARYRCRHCRAEAVLREQPRRAQAGPLQQGIAP